MSSNRFLDKKKQRKPGPPASSAARRPNEVEKRRPSSTNVGGVSSGGNSAVVSRRPSNMEITGDDEDYVTKHLNAQKEYYPSDNYDVRIFLLF